MVDLPRRTLADLLVATGSPDLLDAAGEVLDPVLAVELDAAASTVPLDVPALAERCRVSPRWLIGVDERGTGTPEMRACLDLTFSTAGDPEDPTVIVCDDPWAAAHEVAEQVARAPRAALVLRRVLRIGEHLDVHDAIELESLAYSTLLAGREYRGWLGTRRPVAPPAPVAQAVQVSRPADDVLEIRLDRPERRNSYSRQLRDELLEALEVAHLDPRIERVRLSGEGVAFCSGGDLGEFGLADDPSLAHLVRTTGGAAHSLALLAERTTVQVHGASVGAGVELAAFAGTVVAVQGATFRLPELGMGLIPGAGGTASLPRRIGRWRTAYLVLGDHVIGTDRALAWGLVDAVTAGSTVNVDGGLTAV